MTNLNHHKVIATAYATNAWAKGGPHRDAFIQTHEQRQDMALTAQVHATLYLAEQQHLANLIVWTTQGGHQPTADIQKRIEDGLGL